MIETGLNRKDRERLCHKKEIMPIALKLSADEGFDNVSMHDMANKSEFAVGTLYNFFESKEYLFPALLDKCGERILGATLPVLESDGREDERLREFIRVHSKLAKENIEVIKLYYSEYGTLSPHSLNSAENVKATINKKIAGMIESGIRKKIFRCVEPEVAANALVTTLESLMCKNAKYFENGDLQKNLTALENLFVDGLLSLKSANS